MRHERGGGSERKGRGERETQRDTERQKDRERDRQHSHLSWPCIHHMHWRHDCGYTASPQRQQRRRSPWLDAGVKSPSRVDRARECAAAGDAGRSTQYAARKNARTAANLQVHRSGKAAARIRIQSWASRIRQCGYRYMYHPMGPSLQVAHIQKQWEHLPLRAPSQASAGLQ